VTPRSVAEYARELRGAIPARAFDPQPSRLVWLALHVAVVAAGTALIAAGVPGAALLAVPMGLAFAGMAFVAHEALHGAVVRGSLLRRLVGGVGFLPFLISPRHWNAWHNRWHHGHTMEPGVDPDSYPLLAHYETSRRARAADRLSFGGRRVAGLFTLVAGLVGQSTAILTSAGPRAGYLSRGQHRLALLETAAMLAFWVALGAALGAETLLLAWALPLAIGNVVVMSFILTNHSLSPLTATNDPLLNSLSVTTPRWFERYSLNFGLHVEHHLFPAMSSRHAPLVRDLLRGRFPERYRSMPLLEALGRLFRSGRVYLDATTLIDPRSGTRTPTL
jgi:fatty acid desaturase